MSKSTKILWIIDLMAVEKLLLRGGQLKNVGQEGISKLANQQIKELANQQIWKLENERSVRNYIFNEERLKSRN